MSQYVVVLSTCTINTDNVSQEAANTIQSEEQNTLDHHLESDSTAATAQSAVDENDNDGGDRTIGELEAGL